MLHAETQHEIKNFFAKVLKELNLLNCEYFFMPELNFGKNGQRFPKRGLLKSRYMPKRENWFVMGRLLIPLRRRPSLVRPAQQCELGVNDQPARMYARREAKMSFRARSHHYAEEFRFFSAADGINWDRRSEDVIHVTLQ
jgi:hypothetical protein